MKNEKEAKSMLVETVKELQQDWLDQRIQQGIQQGIQLRNRAIARNLKDSGVFLNIIIRSTGLSEEEIKKL